MPNFFFFDTCTSGRPYTTGAAPFKYFILVWLRLAAKACAKLTGVAPAATPADPTRRRDERGVFLPSTAPRAPSQDSSMSLVK